MPQGFTHKGNLRQESTAPGTPRLLGAGTDGGTNIPTDKRNCSLVMVQALLDNSGNVTVAGAAGVGVAINGTAAGRVGIGLTPGETHPFYCDRVDELALDVITSGDGISAEIYE